MKPLTAPPNALFIVYCLIIFPTLLIGMGVGANYSFLEVVLYFVGYSIIPLVFIFLYNITKGSSPVKNGTYGAVIFIWILFAVLSIVI